jgi:hypothetical protein
VSADSEIFFPPGDSPASEAWHICAMCPVSGQCLAYAIMVNEPLGV